MPVLVLERLADRGGAPSCVELARADYVHALGSLATLAILFGLVKLTLALLLRDLGDAGERAALGLADLVVSPLLFLGAALSTSTRRARAELEQRLGARAASSTHEALSSRPRREEAACRPI